MSHRRELPFREHAADKLKAWFGTWMFLLILNIIFVAEIILHVATNGHWDPGLLLLNLFLSWLAAQQGGALQIAANRGDRISAATQQEMFAMQKEMLELVKSLQHANVELDLIKERLGISQEETCDKPHAAGADALYLPDYPPECTHRN